MLSMTEPDEIDNRIMELLEENSRASNVEIAGAIGISEGTVRNRISRLVKDGYISKFTMLRGTTGISAIILVKVDPKESERVTAELSRLFKDIYEISGKYDLAIQLWCNGAEELNGIINDIREIDGVKSTDSMIKLNYFRRRSSR